MFFRKADCVGMTNLCNLANPCSISGVLEYQFCSCNKCILFFLQSNCIRTAKSRINGSIVEGIGVALYVGLLMSDFCIFPKGSKADITKVKGIKIILEVQ